ncbi:shikimate dehydrogenase [Methanococcoides seepicolus]|uniref:Shikimate dehydrogenase (NADP(+)) n=1 Tax=Methanococcoides seepicolus TaxID=2828780 RepID=A0A9E4ZBH7_9EURY|nr:shikimate dehydrogenase [Methanococcoides seepicolus]MCM1985500.1 shikimate dehydrogenase [Methanococcoides seepicolus]
MKKVFAVLGNPIEHSLSPIMHNSAFEALDMDCTYHAFRVEKNNLEDALQGAKAMGFGGLNLTVPLKETALSFVDADPLAAKIGAINTIDFKDGIKGYNTDGIGAKRTIEDEGVEIKDKNVLILGAGGAARAIAFTFAEAGAMVNIANRTPERAMQLAAEIGDARGYGLDIVDKGLDEIDIIINTTTVGLGNSNGTLVSAEQMHSDLAVFDIVYNPLMTKLLQEAETAGARPITGIMMLVYQGAEAFRIWTGREPPIEIMKRTVMEALDI